MDVRMLRLNPGQARAKLMLEQHTIIQLPFSRGRRVLRSGGSSHLNLSSPPCSPIANIRETYTLSNKRTTTGCSCSSVGGSVVKPLRHLARLEGAPV
jgi:hypothetical protein